MYRQIILILACIFPVVGAIVSPRAFLGYEVGNKPGIVVGVECEVGIFMNSIGNNFIPITYYGLNTGFSYKFGSGESFFNEIELGAWPYGGISAGIDWIKPVSLRIRANGGLIFGYLSYCMLFPQLDSQFGLFTTFPFGFSGSRF